MVTTAPTDHQVKAILWKEIARRRREGDIRGRITLDAKWYEGERLVDEELIGFGRKPQDYDPGAFQGVHAKYVLVLIDEACGVPKQLWDALETLMTNDYARLLAIGNPDDSTSYFEKVCRPNSGFNTIRIAAFDTPNFTREHVPKDVAEQLVTPLWVDERRKKWGVGSPLYQSKVLAVFPEVTEDTLITPTMTRRAHEMTLPGLDIGCYGWDVARFGSDETVGYRNRGGRVRRVYSRYKQDTVKTANDIHKILIKDGILPVPSVVDVVGLGAGVVDELRSRNLNIVPFHPQERPFEPQYYRDRKAECFWHYREMFEQGMVDLEESDEELTAQLTSIKWYIDRHGKINIESKDDMRRRGLPSPDRADASMMASAVMLVLRQGPESQMMPTITGDLLGMIM